MNEKEFDEYAIRNNLDGDQHFAAFSVWVVMDKIICDLKRERLCNNCGSQDE